MKRLFLLLLLFPITVKAYSTSATCAILMDMDTGNIIYSKNIDMQRPIASISKIMTAILAIESGKINDTVTVGEEIKQSYGSGIYIKQGEQLKLIDLIYGLMLRSGNDASYAIAKYVGSDVDIFVAMMNDKAKEIGMKNTTFNNPNGLDDKGGNISTALDMALLTSYAMKNEIYRQVVSTKKYNLKTNMNTYSWTNKHKLLQNYDYITGGKTGYTDVAKRTLVTTATKNNINLVVVTLNDGNDFSDHISLFEEAFSMYTNYQILKKGNINIIDEKYYLNSLYINNDFYYTLENTKNHNVVLNFKLEKNKEFKNNEEVGFVEVSIDNKVVHEEKIYIKVDDKKITFWDKIKAWFKKIW